MTMQINGSMQKTRLTFLPSLPVFQISRAILAALFRFVARALPVHFGCRPTARDVRYTDREEEHCSNQHLSERLFDTDDLLWTGMTKIKITIYIDEQRIKWGGGNGVDLILE